ncbi:hypothetical protein ACVIKO_000885 [Rhizobium ruizarguesonis]
MLAHYPDKAGHRKRRDRSAHIGRLSEPSATSMNGFGGRGFKKDFESLFQGGYQNIGQLIALVFQEPRAHSLVLTLKETLNLIRHIICPLLHRNHHGHEKRLGAVPCAWLVPE